MASQPTTGDKQRFRCRVQEIKLEPDKSAYDITVELQVDGTKVYKLPPIKKGQLLHWTSLCLPCDVLEDSAITLQVTEVHRLKDRIGRAVYHMPQVVGQDTVPMKCNNGMFTAYLALLSKESTEQAYAEAFVRAQQMENQPGVLERIGRVGNAFKVLLALGSAMAELDPTGGAKEAFSLCTKAWEYLETQEKQDAQLNELVENIAGMIPSVELVGDLADANLAQTVMAMLNLVEDVSLFILNSRARGSFERTFRSAFNSTAQERMDVLVGKFRRLRKEFDTRVGVQALRAAELDRIKAKLQELHPVDRASYDPERQCIAGTRAEIIEELANWTRESGDGPRLAWVRGLAGLGKSSIATSVCRQLDGLGAIACSFFCKRDNPELRDPRRVLTTIIYGLALRWEAYGDVVVAMIREDPELPSKHIQSLYDSLVIKPLQQLSEGKRPAGTLVVVVDALDECGDDITRKRLLTCLRGLSQFGPWLRVVVTSRPDRDIQEFFRPAEANWYTEFNILDYDALADIRVFLQARLADTPDADGWPKDAVEQLALHSNGLFIWAQTACKFILSGFDTVKRLGQVLDGTQVSDSTADLDTLYTTAVRASALDGVDDNMEFTLKCLGIVVATATRTPLSISGLALLLQGHIPLNVLRRVLDSLSSVIYADRKQNGAIRISHPSFMDYITDPSRSNDLCVDLNKQNTILARCCLSTLGNNLKLNICSLETSHLLNSDVPDLDERVRNAIQPHLRYSCLYWSSHIAEARLDTLDSSLRRFLFGPELVYWLEVLSLLGKLSVALASLLQFIACCDKESLQDCHVLANDAYRFVLSFYDAISRSTPHLYVSALAFAPENSEISRRMRKFFPKLLTVTQGAEKEWTRCLRSIWVSSVAISVAFSPDSRRIASGSWDGTVRIWDAETGDPVLEPLEDHTEVVTSVAFSPNGRWIASGSWDRTIRVWDAETGEARMGPLRGHSDRVWSVAFASDSRRIVSGSSDTTIRVWDAETGKSVFEPLQGHTDEVTSVAFSPDSHWIVSGSCDDTVRIWDAQTGSAACEPLKGHSRRVASVTFSPDSQLIASCSEDATLRIWDAKTGDAVLGPLEGHSACVQSIAFSADGRRLISGSDDRTVRIWNARTGDMALDTLDSHSAPVQSVASSLDGRRVVSGSWDKTMRIWDVVDAGNSRVVKDSITSKGHSSWVNSVGFSSNGRYVVSGSDDKTVRIWDADTGAAVLTPFEDHTGGVLSVAFSSDDRRVASGSRDKTIRIWSTETGDAVLEPLQGHSGAVLSVAFSPDGHHIASGSEDGTIRIWNAETGAQKIPPLMGHSGNVNSVAFSPDGHRLVSGSDDCTIRIWDTETGQLALEPLTGHSNQVTSVAFSADGHNIASGSGDESVRIWDAETGGAVLDPLRGHTGRVRSVAFSSNGRWIASGSDDWTVRIWDAMTGEAVLEPMRGHLPYVLAVAFSPDGRRIASGSADKTVRIWDAELHTASAVHGSEFLPGTEVRVFPPQVRDGKLLVTSAQLAQHLSSDLTGWVTSTEGKLLVWLPPDLRDTDESLVCISESRVQRQSFIDFTAFVHGSSWASIAEV